MAFSLASIAPTAGGISSFLKIVIWGTLIILPITLVSIIIRNRIKYQYTAEIFKRRQDEFQDGAPTAVVLKGKAGYFMKRTGKTVFRIRFGAMPWQQIELSKLPDPKYMIGNKTTYVQLNKDNYVQCKVNIDWDGAFSLEPVEDDLKYGASLDIAEKSSILKTESALAKAMPFIMMGVILVAGIIVFYFNSKACG